MTTKEERVAAIDQAITRGGGIVRFCKGMNITHQSVYAWRERGWVPPERAIVIESVFGIPREKLMNPALVDLINKPKSSAEDLL